MPTRWLNGSDRPPLDPGGNHEYAEPYSALSETPGSLVGGITAKSHTRVSSISGQDCAFTVKRGGSPSSRSRHHFVVAGQVVDMDHTCSDAINNHSSSSSEGYNRRDTS